MTPSDLNRYRYLQFKDNATFRRYIQNEEPKAIQSAYFKKIAADPSPHGTYGGLLFHPKWKAKRREILTRDKYQCVNCKSNKELQVHHRQYHFIASQNRFCLPWDYSGHLLITLCGSCHKRGHNKYKVPTITV
jgi:hypothetical protein